MTMQPDQFLSQSERWSWAVQRELDGFQRTLDSRLSELANRIDRAVGNNEYVADKRSSDIQLSNVLHQISDVSKDLEALRTHCDTELRGIRSFYDSEVLRLERIIAEESKERKEDHKEYVRSKQSQMRWFVSMVLIPTVLVIVQLLMSHK